MKIKAHVPTQQYGFIEITGEPEDQLEIERLYNQYAESPIAFKKGSFVRVRDFFGNEIDWDVLNHIYQWQGVQYESASTIAKGTQRPFDSVMMSGKVATDDVNAETIARMWELGGKISREFGTNIHEALEVYGKYLEACKKLGKEYHIPNHPVLKNIVESFYEGREAEKAEYEVLVVDHKARRAGTIDRLVVTAPQTCIIEDYKITHKEDKKYWKAQLDVYEELMVANGWQVVGKKIHQYDGAWKTHDSL